MSEIQTPSSSAWCRPPDLDFPPVPDRYRGVWRRSLLETPRERDTTTAVHWLQTDRWHADLRVPSGVNAGTAEGRMQLQGFCGLTRITPGERGQPDVCTWHRLWDIQPPRSTSDAGYMVFDTPDRLVETGVHGQYLEVWERLPDTDGPFEVNCQDDGSLMLRAGTCTMVVRPRKQAWPSDLGNDETLADVALRYPAQAEALLDFSISLSFEDEANRV